MVARVSSHEPPVARTSSATIGGTGSSAPTDDTLTRKRTWRRLFVRVVVVGAVGLLALRGCAGGHGGWAHRATPKQTAATSTASTSEGPLVGSCPKTLHNECAIGTVPWCDVMDRVIACCGFGLVASGTDGICDCAPGGEPQDANVPSCARKAESMGIPGAAKVIAELRPKFAECYAKGRVANPMLVGRTMAELQVAPDGRVFHARISEGRLPSPSVERCLLDELRVVRFGAPAGGQRAELLVPVTFEAPAEAAAITRRLCKAKGSCSPGSIAWCDADEKELACCAEGLVAVGTDGMCECAPGGVTSGAGGCPRPTMTKDEWLKAYDSTLMGASDAFMKCIAAADAGVARGDVEIDLRTGPHGHVTPYIRRSSMPDVFAQRCVLEALRSATVPPPADGFHQTSNTWEFVAPKR